MIHYAYGQTFYNLPSFYLIEIIPYDSDFIRIRIIYRITADDHSKYFFGKTQCPLNRKKY
jgi:hypothetical protein